MNDLLQLLQVRYLNIGDVVDVLPCKDGPCLSRCEVYTVGIGDSRHEMCTSRLAYIHESVMALRFDLRMCNRGFSNHEPNTTRLEVTQPG